jgi:hypothetical protein
MALRYGGSAARAGSDTSTQALAQALGWFSIGLGAAELVAPQHLARLLGMEGQDDLIRTYGAREIVTGVGILSQDDPTPWMWARVGGDALDLGTLAMRLGPDNPQRTNVGLAMAAVAGVTALDVYCAQALAGEREAERLPIWDYSDRSGLPRPPAAMRGAARDYQVPPDMRIPEALRPYASG